MAELFEPGQRVRLPHGPSGWLTIDFARPDGTGGWILYVAPEDGDTFRKVALTADEAALVETLEPDGGGSSAGALAGMWTLWMTAAIADTTVSPPSATPLQPYIHQHNAVYGAMLPQPRLRFLLADEPGTGKTVMVGMYIREMRRLGSSVGCWSSLPPGLSPRSTVGRPMTDGGRNWPIGPKTGKWPPGWTTTDRSCWTRHCGTTG